ncbi:helix-turn-helix domain-containing protein [Pseudahrensia aquimaris]|uniref:Helix-turn-helix domain-containing protein n=1 Tax=Pseudahrensia aquimaris TaxID=744461 RepID=A0ABW3FG81_9HYPH
MDDLSAFGVLVKQRRTTLGLTQEALAAEALGNLDRKGYISNIERGTRPRITSATAKKICDALEIDLADVPASLRWRETIDEGRQDRIGSNDTLSPFAGSVPDHTLVTAQGFDRGGSTPFQKQLLGIGLLIALIVLSAEILDGLSSIAANIWPDGRFSFPRFFAWCTAILFVLFYFFGFEGSGANSRAQWLERGTWRDRYLDVVERTLAWTDRLFLTPDQFRNLPQNSINRNWSIGLYEKAWGFAIVYPAALLLLQWTITGAGQQLGFLQLWPPEPDASRRALVALSFLVPIALSFVARSQTNDKNRIALCALALVINLAGTTYLWSVYWNILVGAGAMNMISFAFILGVGLRLFDTVAGAIAAAAIAGASLSFLFLPLVEISEFITGRDQMGYTDPVVNITHTVLNHSLNIIIFFVCLKLISRFIKPGYARGSQKKGVVIYAIVTLGAAALMVIAAGQQFWFSYYFLIGLLPLINALFDFMSIGLTRLALRLGAQKFGVRTLFFSGLDLTLAVFLLVALVLTASAVAVGLNWAAGLSAFPLQSGALTCLENIDPALSGLAHSSVKGVTGVQSACSDSIIASLSTSPQDFTWLLLVFGSTLLPTILHLGFALFALGPALLSNKVRLRVASWARKSAYDPFMRGGAALFISAWLSVIVTVTLFAIEQLKILV